jgi:hypothetical protein
VALRQPRTDEVIVGDSKTPRTRASRHLAKRSVNVSLTIGQSDLQKELPASPFSNLSLDCLPINSACQNNATLSQGFSLMVTIDIRPEQGNEASSDRR